MSTPRLLLFAVSAFALASCNPFHRGSSVQVSTKDATLNSRWHANLATPAGLAGAVQMNGTASMAPAPKGGNTTVSYPVAKVGRDGHATSLANLTLDTPTVGSYFVSVSASAANDAVTVACGNLAPPTL